MQQRNMDRCNYKFTWKVCLNNCWYTFKEEHRRNFWKKVALDNHTKLKNALLNKASYMQWVLGLKQQDKNKTEAAQKSSLSKLRGVSITEIIMGEEIRKMLGTANTVEEL